MSDIQIVAEIGCNHNGSVELAKKMMKKAKEAGADAVKFQSFVPENLVSRYAPKAEYQKKMWKWSQLDMLKKLALTETELFGIGTVCFYFRYSDFFYAI